MKTTDWNIKYEPKELDEMILNPAVRNKLSNIFRTPQNVILYGAPGVGKGTFTNIFIKKNGCFDMRINASKETGIDMIREKVFSFVYAGNPTPFFDVKDADGDSYKGRHQNLKVMVLNEAENLSLQSQAALRELIEEVENRCKFIFMTNKIDKIDDAIKSRCPPVEISNPPIGDIIRHIEKILDAEEIRYDGGALTNIVLGCYPDIRRTVKEVQNRCNEQELIYDDSFKSSDTIDKVLLDLRLHMAYWNKERKEIYNLIKDKLEFHVGERQFYYLLSGKNQNKIKENKKVAIISCIQENINLRDWLNEYLKQ